MVHILSSKPSRAGRTGAALSAASRGKRGAAPGVSSALTGHRLDQSSSSQTYQMERYEFRLLWRANRFLPRQPAGGLGTRAGGELASRSAKDEDAP